MTLNKSLLELLSSTESSEINDVHKTNIDGETFQIELELKKEGIQIKFTPISESGDFIKNLTEEEVESLKNSLIATLTPKFTRFKLELSAEDASGEDKSVTMLIPEASIFPFIELILKR